ncbi:hypothetical protein DAT35_25140 [Vitiosangium sp. GDMCC 1.1324]|nr:hypothetical protein DAT35_25140 [Vitiosangium sp. GDMCC 1.1324]
MGAPFTQRRASLGWTAALLFFVPLATYWSTIFHRYGMRDDYAILREAREEPGKILKVCSSIGRPFYGWLLETSTRAAGGIDGLCWMRLAAAVCLGLLGSSLFLLLVQEGWSLPIAALLAASLTLTPSAQVIASWAICWPQALALLLGTGAFALASRGMRCPPGARARWGWWLLAALTMASATLTYQASGLFYAVLLAASLTVRRDDTLKETLQRMARHLCVMGVGLGLAFLTTQILYVTGVFTRSPRIAFETHWLSKAGWMVTDVLPHVLALIVLDDTRGTPSVGYLAMVVLTLTTVTLGIVLEGRRAGATGYWRWLLGLVTLSGAAWCVSFLAGERWPTYRTLYALTGVWTVFFAASLVNLGALRPSRGQQLATALLGVFAIAGALLGHRQSFELFAAPQGRELALMEEGVRQIALAKHPRVFVITARQNDTSAPLRYLDEFGSVSIDTEWVAKEVLKMLLAERFPDVQERNSLYRFAAGASAPEPRAYDVVIDMRRLRQAGGDFHAQLDSHDASSRKDVRSTQ